MIKLFLICLILGTMSITGADDTKFDSIQKPPTETEGEKEMTFDEIIDKYINKKVNYLIHHIEKSKGKGLFKMRRKKMMMHEEKYMSQIIAKLFSKYDEDKDGLCNATETLEIFKYLHKEHHEGVATEKECEIIFKHLDSDGDGKVSKGDILGLIRGNVEKLKERVGERLKEFEEDFGLKKKVSHDMYKGYKKLMKKVAKKMKKIEKYPGNWLDKYSEEHEGNLNFTEFEHLMDEMHICLQEPLISTEKLEEIFNKHMGEDKHINQQELKDILLNDLANKLSKYKEAKEKYKKAEDSFDLLDAIADVIKEVAKFDDETLFDKEAKELYGLKCACKEKKLEEKKKRNKEKKEKTKGKKEVDDKKKYDDKKKKEEKEKEEEKKKKEKEKKKEKDEDKDDKKKKHHEPKPPKIMDVKRFRKVVDDFYDDIDADFMEMSWETKNNIFKEADKDTDEKLSYEEFVPALKKVIQSLKEHFKDKAETTKALLA